MASLPRRRVLLVYLVHLPVVVALQIALAAWAVPWWIQWPLVHLLAFPLLLGSYHGLVRRTWVGTWLQGRKIGGSGLISR